MKMTYTLWLIIINFIVFFAQVVLYNVDFIADSYGEIVTDVLGLNTKTVLERGYFWQYFTYMFVHADFTHIFFNMFGLLVFGPKIEYTMGKSKFLKYYLICGLGSSVFYSLIICTLMGVSNIPMVGASGAIFGVLTAFGIMYPRDIVYVQFFIPMPAIVFICFYGLIQLLGGVLSLFGPQTGGIAYFGHLGGMITGIILLKWFGFGRRRVRYFWE
jgi:membrane associated rhomboid family serine protease